MSSRGRPEEAQAALVQCQGLGAIEAEKQVQEMILASASTSTSAEDEDDSVQAKISEIFDSPYVIIRGLTCCVLELWLLLYTVVVIFHISISIVSYNTTNMVHDQHTNNNP
tara:strand:- start:17 stop:349 length:333 start_codon:yes stop_codon:yes gene_type:complete